MVQFSIVLGAAAALAALMNAGPALAFDCARAESAAEKAICSDAATKASDDAMARAYVGLKPLLDPEQAAALVANQRAWLAHRNHYCTSGSEPAACIRTMNDARTFVLEGRAESGPGARARLLPFFLDTAGGDGKAESHILMYRLRDSSPLAKTLDAAIKEDLAQARQAASAGEGEKASVERTAKIVYASDRLISIEMTGFDYVQGAAHGTVTTRMLNIDGKSGRALRMADFLDAAGRAKALALCLDQVLSEKAKRAAEAARETAAADRSRPEPPPPLSPEEVKTVRDEAQPILATLSSWRFGADAATVVFDQDAIGAHAEGAYACNLPYAQLRALAKPSFPLPGGGP